MPYSGPVPKCGQTGYQPKAGAVQHLRQLFMRTPTMMTFFLPQPHLLRRQVQISHRGQLGISGSRRSIDIVSSEYSQQQLARNQETDHTRSTESSGLTSRKNSPWEHRLERATVELNDEGEHQIEQVAVLSREVEAKNVTDGSDGFGLSTPLGWSAAQHAGLGRVDSSGHVARSRGLDN
jgi:hypothetical protein